MPKLPAVSVPAAGALALLALLAVPRVALAYPVFSPEREVAAPSSYVYGSSESSPAVASDGTNFLVAWPEYGGAIECARVAPGPVLLDRPSLPLSLKGKPQVFWDGTKYLVVASGQAQRIDAATGAPAPVFTLQGAPATGRAMFGGGEILDVWQAADGSLEGGIFDLTGAKTSAGATIALPSGAVSDWGVAASPGQFLVGWITPAGVVAAARVSTAGVVFDATPVVIAGGGDAGAPAAASINVAGSPGQYLVSWISGTSPYAHDYSARVATTGAVADPGGVYMNGGIGYQGRPSVAAWDGTEWWIVDTSSSSYSVAETFGSTGSPSAPVQYDGYPVAAIAATPNARLAVSAFDQSIVAATVTTTGAGSIVVTGQNSLGISVSTQPAPQSPVCTVGSSAGYLVAWSEAQSVLGMRFQVDGTPIDHAPFALGAAGGGGACGVLGDTYYFGGDDLEGLYSFQGDLESFPTTGALVLTKNVVPIVPDGGTAVSTYPRSMACMADRCLLLSVEGQTVWATIFGPGGNVLLAPFSVTWLSYATPGLVVAATDGSSFFVLQSPQNQTAGVVVLDPSGAQSSPFVAEATLFPSAVAGGGGRFLVAATPDLLWFDSTASAVGAPQPLPTVGGVGMVWDGSGFFVTQLGLGMEVSATPPKADAGVPAPLTTYPLFTSSTSGPTFVASNGAGDVIALTTEPRGSFATPVLIARFGAPGPDAPDGGVHDGGSSPDGGSADGGGGTDASLDGTVSVEPDASSADDDGGPSSVGAEGGAPDDASIAADGGAAAAGAQSGCGCTSAGGGIGYSSGWLGIAALALLRGRRGRRAV